MIWVSNLSGAFAEPRTTSSVQIRTEFLQDGTTAVRLLNHRCRANEKQEETDNVCLEHQAMVVAHGIKGPKPSQTDTDAHS